MGEKLEKSMERNGKGVKPGNSGAGRLLSNGLFVPNPSPSPPFFFMRRSAAEELGGLSKFPK